MKYIKGRYYSAFREEIWKCTVTDKCFHAVYPAYHKDYPIRQRDSGYGPPEFNPITLDLLMNYYQIDPHTPLIAKFVRGALKQLAAELLI